MRLFAIVPLLVFSALAADAATITVTQTGLTFDPAEITIDVGDTVTWVHTTGSHTVTSGTGAAAPDAGDLFDMALTSGSVSHTFTAAGDVPYFCRPHEAFGMTGLVHVVEEVDAEASSLGAVKRLFR